VVELSKEVLGGAFPLFSPFDSRADGHGLSLCFLQLLESVGDGCYGGWIGTGCSLEFIEPVC
jgi:hypothetical protein